MKIAIVELGGSHDECLYSQIKIIKSCPNIHLTLICNKSLEGNIKHFNHIDKKIFLSVRKGYKQWADIFRFWQLCKTNSFDKIIFNTAQGKVISRIFRLPFKKHIKLYGILHDTKKINSSHSQKYISKKIEHYFVLSEYLKNKIKSTSSFSVLYPIYFPDYLPQEINKKKNEIWICIPGQVELKRRDYKTLFESIQKYGISKNIKFLLLGRCEHKHGDGAYIKQKISELSVTDNFLIWDGFIPVTTFYSMIKNSDYIMPLIHDNDISGDLYNTQISGAYNLAVAYKKPILAEKEISNKILSEYSPITYDNNYLMKTINQLEQYDGDNLYTDEKWTFDFQRKIYLEHIGVTLPNQIDGTD